MAFNLSNFHESDVRLIGLALAQMQERCANLVAEIQVQVNQQLPPPPPVTGEQIKVDQTPAA